MGWFTFKKRYDNLGVGPRDYGVLPRTTLPAGGSYLGPQWNIKRSMAPFSAPGFMMLNGAVVPSNTLQNGFGVQGQYALMPLAQNTKQGS